MTRISGQEVQVHLSRLLPEIATDQETVHGPHPHRFTLIVEGSDLQAAALIDSLFEAGRADATVVRTEAVQYLAFDGDGKNLRDTSTSAVAGVERVEGLQVTRVAGPVPDLRGVAPPRSQPAPPAAPPASTAPSATSGTTGPISRRPPGPPASAPSAGGASTRTRSRYDLPSGSLTSLAWGPSRRDSASATSEPVPRGLLGRVQLPEQSPHAPGAAYHQERVPP